MYPLKEWIWLRRLCPKKTENFTKRLKLKFLRIIHTIKLFFAGRYLLFYGIEFKGTEIYTPYSQEGECICGRYTG